MEDSLKIVTACIDAFSKREELTRHAAIIGGEAVILHGVPRTTIDVDVLVSFSDHDGEPKNPTRELSSFLQQELGDQYRIAAHHAARDPEDPLKHDILIVTDLRKEYKKLDVLIANFDWEIEGLLRTEHSEEGDLPAYAKPYLVAMKLMAGGAQDEEDIRNLFYLMTEAEREETRELARQIRKDRNLSTLLQA
jgi:hypothetical protein